MRIETIRQRLRDHGAKPGHEHRVLRLWACALAQDSGKRKPEDFLPRSPFPADAQRMGIDRWSDDAAMIAIASSLDSRKLSHRVIAWLMLVCLTTWLVAQLWFELKAA